MRLLVVESVEAVGRCGAAFQKDDYGRLAWLPLITASQQGGSDPVR